ncbi:hypothetical protein DYB30_010422 [Aphanomyces astaci]|uniref:Uncharacterized protein n=3 Tax=Aphanomyces astaci TaxID=112090 RepID=A0A397DKS0_APHAT|nr:hypothetical protein DYB30_010422 [Aphanomyces astaci]RHY66194.1 hypothetical protein DYB38_009993 [Aphanomyces astaci]
MHPDDWLKLKINRKMDAADLLDQYTDAIYAATYTAEEVAALKARKKLNETVMLCRTILQDESWEHDATVNELDVYLTYASALESLTRRYEAIDVLVRGLDVMDDHPMLQLALARLQFKAGLYDDALETCLLVTQAYPHDTRCSADSAADAYHLAGWVKIHGDDHTNAYALWSRGALAIPSSSVLARQHRKRQCWDNDAPDDFLLPRGLVHLHAECDAVIDIVDAFHRDVRHGQWGTVRHSSVNTTDVAVEDIPLLRPWLRKLLKSRVYPFLHECFPRLADHTSMRDDATGATRCRVHDAFIVR